MSDLKKLLISISKIIFRTINSNLFSLILNGAIAASAITLAVATGGIFPIILAGITTTTLTCAITKTGLDAVKHNMNDKLIAQHQALIVLVHVVNERAKILRENHLTRSIIKEFNSSTEINKHTNNARLAKFEKHFNRAFDVISMIQGFIYDYSIFNALNLLNKTRFAEVLDQFQSDDIEKFYSEKGHQYIDSPTTHEAYQIIEIANERKTEMKDLINDLNKLRVCLGENSRDPSEILRKAAIIQKENDRINTILSSENTNHESVIKSLKLECLNHPLTVKPKELENLRKDMEMSEPAVMKAIIKSLFGCELNTDYKLIYEKSKEPSLLF